MLKVAQRVSLAVSASVRLKSATATATAARVGRSLSTASHRHVIRSDSSISKTTNDQHEDRLLVIGSGVAGSAAALIAAEQYQIPVTLLFAGHLSTDCNSYWAQGGIIYRNHDVNSGDSAASLAQDIQRAGAGLCEHGAVWKVANEGPDRVRQLLLNNEHGSNVNNPYCQVPFERSASDSSEYALCLEASHAAPRILFTADHTGRSITECLSEALIKHPLITLQPHTVVTDLIVMESNESSSSSKHCLGVTTLNRTTGATGYELANHGTVLCSGGLAGIYQHSTNPAGFNALGSSVGLAQRAGAVTRDLEFVQFHPTALSIPGQPSFLVSEAVRGDGAKLVNANGHFFAADYHADAELAPRDVVARAVYAESQATGKVYLDLSRSGHSVEYIHHRFPSIQAHLQKHGLDLARNKIPILPAAHYTCGGVVTDEHGVTNINNLYAAGEAARTGLHGGNRLASTSLLEGLVYGAAVADHVGTINGRASEWVDTSKRLLQDSNKSNVNDWVHETVLNNSALVNGSNNATHGFRHRHKIEPQQIESAGYAAMTLLKEVRRCMWDNVGVVRTPSGLTRALDELDSIRRDAIELYAKSPTLETAAVRDAAYAGYAVTEAASRNKTSIGAHHIVADDEDMEESELEEAASAVL
ncbi:hypothetical protein MPSEU_000668500 [Mayamaea pseudoterrestris]|nr:hypothetical protein MPSEU_000668500 [Mayamaea pseudoterrestris]